MNYTDLKKQIRILLVDEDQAGAICGKRTVFHDICARYNLKPVVQKNSVKLWAVEDIETAIAKLRLDQLNA